MQKAMAATKEAMANVPPEMRKMMEAAMAQAGAAGTDMDAQMADLQKQGSKALKEQNAAVAKADAKAAESRLNAKEFDQRYPANPDRFIAARLREFLALTATVPADAALVRRSGSLRVYRPGARGQAAPTGNSSIAPASPRLMPHATLPPSGWRVLPAK